MTGHDDDIFRGDYSYLQYAIAAFAVVFGLIGVLQPRYFLFDTNLEYTLFLWTACLSIYWLQVIDEEGAMV